MLKHLSIKNYALIRSLNLDLENGLTVMTGETGSGKSIILGALGLVLGERADLKSLSNLEKKCIIEATFKVDNSFVSFFQNYDLDYFPDTVMRREITPSGKSRAFINDTPVNLNQLKELGGRLVEIHSQDQNSILSNKEFQFEIIDSFAGLTADSKEYESYYKTYSRIRKELKELQELEKQSQADLDYFQFQLKELEDSQLDYIDKESLESELKLMDNSEDISRLANMIYNVLDEEENSVISQLNILIGELGRYSELHPGFNSINKRLNSAMIELQDISSESQNIGESLQIDPERLVQVRTILDEINHLENKHRVNSVEELIKVRDDISTKLDNVSNLESEIEQKQLELDKLLKAILEKANFLHEKRSDSISGLESKIKNVLSHLGMAHAEVRIQLLAEERPGKNGLDNIEFLFCANPGSSFQPVDKVASGGEKSRLLLALKKVFSDLAFFPTLILDEIDSGVSGEVARKVAEVMKMMSVNSQLIAITHLPQIAGLGDQHFKVSKEVKEGLTRTQINILDNNQRIDEIAEMLSGKDLSDAARENARELLSL